MRAALIMIGLLALACVPLPAQVIERGPRARALDPNAPKRDVSGTVVNAVSGEPIPRARVQLSGLPSGQKRWMRVRAVNDSGPGSWSDPSCRMIP